MTLTGVNLVGNLASEKGVGEAARCLARAARATGLPIALDNFTDTGAGNVDPSLGPTAGHLLGARPHPVTLLAINPDTLPLYRSQADPRQRRAAHTIGYWFWELPQFPAAWADRFADVDEVLTGSTFAQQAIARSSPVPVAVLPPALDPDPPHGSLTRTALRLDPSAFVVLFAFDAASHLGRKNPTGLVRAFRTAFPSEPDVRLVLKASRLSQAPDRGHLLAACQGDPRIMVLDGLLSRPDLTNLLALCDCYASLHRAEGFGLTLAEAMVLGKTVVATGWSGNLDFMTPFNSLPVDYRLTTLEQDHGPYPAGQIWAEPVEADAAEKLRWVYRNREMATRVAARGRADVLALCHPQVVGARLRERICARPLVPRAAEPGRPTTVPARWFAHDGQPVADTTLIVAAPDEPGDYLLELSAASGEPVRQPVHVTGPTTDDFDYRKVYSTANLEHDYWTVVGPSTRAEYDRLAGVKRELLQSLGLTPTSRLLDVGCGTGQLAQAIEPFLTDDGAYHGTDLAPEAVAFCRRRFRRANFTFAVNASDHLERPTVGFDAAALFSVFTHTFLPETAGLLRALAAALVPGGFALADVFTSPVVAAQAGRRGAVRVNRGRFLELVRLAGLDAIVVTTEPFGRRGERVFFRLDKP